MEQVYSSLLPFLSVALTAYPTRRSSDLVPEIVPLADIVSPAGRPVAEKVYGPPAPLLPVIVTGAMATPWIALMRTQLGGGAGLTAMKHVNRPPLPVLSVNVTE